MKKKLLFSTIWVVLLLAFGMLSLSYAGPGSQDGEVLTEGQSINQVSCSMQDELGNPITTAQAGDVVRLTISHPAITGPTRQFIFRVPSSSTDYEDVFLYVKKYTGASSGAVVYMKLQPYTYVEGNGVFVGNVPGHGNCYTLLQVLP